VLLHLKSIDRDRQSNRDRGIAAKTLPKFTAGILLADLKWVGLGASLLIIVDSPPKNNS
jgi:hypothetical protein